MMSVSYFLTASRSSGTDRKHCRVAFM